MSQDHNKTKVANKNKSTTFSNGLLWRIDCDLWREVCLNALLDQERWDSEVVCFSDIAFFYNLIIIIFSHYLHLDLPCLASSGAE